MSSDTFTVIDMDGNVSDDCLSAPEQDHSKSKPNTRPRRYNLRRTIKKPLTYGEQYCNVSDRRNTRDAVFPDFTNCTVDYNEDEGSYTIYGFKHGKEYFTTRKAKYIGLVDTCNCVHGTASPLCGCERDARPCDVDDDEFVDVNTTLLPDPTIDITAGTLDGFIIMPYGRGYLLMPPTNKHKAVGTKYFYETWWMPSRNAWFFRPKFYKRICDRGATLIED
jgi:hypothetical protein